MGKAEIITHEGMGLYNAQIIYDKASIEYQLEKIADRLTKIVERIEELETELATKEAELSTANSELDTAIAAFNAAWSAYYAEKIAYINSLDPSEVDPAERPLEPDEDVPGWDTLQDQLVAQRMAQAEVDRVQTEIDYEKFAKESLTLRQAELQGVLNSLDGDVRAIWCADLTFGLSGEVGTMEIKGQPGQILAHPPAGGLSGLGGKLAPIIGMTPAQAAFNWAVLPGWQRWMPTYRVGVISNIDFNIDTATVTLDDAYSVAQNLPVNFNGVLVGIPVVYMDCNASAFEEGDRVVVKMSGQQWEDAKVIGFETNPKPCARPVVGIALCDYDQPMGAYAWIGYYHPLTDDLGPGEWRLLGREDESNEYVSRLEHIGQASTQGRTLSSTQTIEPKPSNVIFEEEFVYRDLLGSQGDFYGVQPVAFTCGSYEPITPYAHEVWNEYVYYVKSTDHTSYNIVIDGVTIASGTRNYVVRRKNMKFVKNYTIPADLAADGWSSEQIANCCYPPGEYEIWEQQGLAAESHTGEQLSWLGGESTDDVGEYTKGQHGACLYGYYYHRDPTDYDFELRFWADGQEQVIYRGTRTPTFMPDDIVVWEFKAYDYFGKPCYVFSFSHYFFEAHAPSYLRYGVFYDGELRLTEEFPETSWWSQRFWVYGALGEYRGVAQRVAECVGLCLGGMPSEEE